MVVDGNLPSSSSLTKYLQQGLGHAEARRSGNQSASVTCLTGTHVVKVSVAASQGQ